MFIAPALFAQTMDPAPMVEMVKHDMPGAHVGLLVRDLDSGEWLYRYHALDQFTPASNQKMLLAVAALTRLGRDYRYETTVAMQKKCLRAGTLQGDLVFTLTGDPSFTEADLKKLVRQVRRAGIRHVKRVVIDGSRFSGARYAMGWSQDDLAWGYAAPSSTVILDGNRMPVTFKPSSVLGKPVHVQLDRMHRPYLVKSNVRTVSEDAAEHHCSVDVQMDAHNRLRLGGCWPVVPEKLLQYFAIRHPRAYFKDRLRVLFANAGVTVGEGGYVFAQPSVKLKRIAVHRSKPLYLLMGTMLCDSNNVYADSFLKTMGWEAEREGSFHEGVNAMKATLSETLDRRLVEADWFDGSGGSRYDQVSPELLGRLLYVMYHNKALYDDFYNALPVGGYNGTLRGRMRGFDLKNNVKAKSGTMRHVSTLSGYMSTQTGRHLGFVIFINDVPGGSVASARDLQDRLCQFLYQA